MKIGFTGSRNATYKDVEMCLRKAPSFDPYNKNTFIVGDCLDGGDKYFLEIAGKENCEIKYANWNKYRKSAGPIRNGEIVKHSDALIACWSGDNKNSKGTRNCINQALDKGIPIYVYIFKI